MALGGADDSSTGRNNLKAEAVVVGELDVQEEQPGGEGEAAWVPGSGKNLSAAAVLLAECQQENFVKRGARVFWTELDLVSLGGKAQAPPIW